jgi:5-methyltetrahydrofolate--homocysteine methyltransferase
MDALRHQQLDNALATRILIIDGAMGTMLQAKRPTETDYGGARLVGCNENLCHTRPGWVLDVHRAYLEAGADIIETNSFQGSSIVLAEFGLGPQAHELNVTAARLARQAADEFSTTSKPRFVAGALGPTTKSITLRGDVIFDQLIDSYYAQAKALLEGGVDMLLFETVFDTRNVKAGLVAIRKLGRDLDRRIPLMIAATIERGGTMLAGQSVDAFYASVSHADPLAIGLNCATGPDMMTEHIRALAAMASTRICCYPNAGLPNEDGEYLETPDSFARQLEKFVEQGWLNIVGGCCGTTPAHIRTLALLTDGWRPHAVNLPSRRAYYSGIELVEAEESTRPLIVGERANATGSRLFCRFIEEGKWEEATEIGRRQVRNGAQLLDVCLQSADRDEIKDIDAFYAHLMPKIKVPLMIETTDAVALERALTWCQGKSIVNSVSLEDGHAQFERVCPIARTHGAALVVGTIDEDKLQAQAFTRERKLGIAQRSVELLIEQYGIAPEDIIIDPLVFPCGSGDESYIGGAVETIEAVRLIKERIPFVKTLLGVSAVSFGLPDAARPVVNSVFLYHATKAGLDLAMVNAEKLRRFASISSDERRLVENLLFNAPVRLSAGLETSPGNDESNLTAASDWRQQTREQKIAIHQFHLSAITDHFRKAARGTGEPTGELLGGSKDPPLPDRGSLHTESPPVHERRPLDERLANYIIEGTKAGLIADLDLKLQQGAAPLDIINGPLMAGMTEVGRLFNDNELIVAEVLQSAEVMNAGVAYLRPLMETIESVGAKSGVSHTRATILLATVKGDVHDIGKNLVEIVLSTNGYRVINLGIRVPSEDLIQACRVHRPDAIGLSGLLVKSAHQMVATAVDLKDHGVDVPLIVGGAALSETFTRTRIGPAYGGPTFYAKDAMVGLRLMNQLLDPAMRGSVLETHARSEPDDRVPVESAPVVAISTARSSKVRSDCPIPAAPDLHRRVREIADKTVVWSYINPFMLYNRHLGFKGDFEKRLAERDTKALELFHLVERTKQETATFLRIRAVWRFFEAERHGNAIRLFSPGSSTPRHTFQFPRQSEPDGLCLSDYVLDAEDGRRDHIGAFVVTAGEGVRQRSGVARQQGEFLLSHAIQALAIETAEACAEWLHRRMREEWGFPDPPTMTLAERLTARYRGKRYSFGYPACPNLEDQQGIWTLLKPEDIGVHLTEGLMMDPEASVSALVFHHPDCLYFAVAKPSMPAAGVSERGGKR